MVSVQLHLQYVQFFHTAPFPSRFQTLASRGQAFLKGLSSAGAVGSCCDFPGFPSPQKPAVAT